MENQWKYYTCLSCGKRLERSPEVPPCELLEGWLTISRWRGIGSVEHYSFCSLSCLKSWVDAHVTKVPKVFLESFLDEES